MHNHPPVPTEPETEVVSQSTSGCGTTTEVEFAIDGSKLSMAPTERGSYWLKPSIICFDGLLFYTVLYYRLKSETSGLLRQFVHYYRSSTETSITASDQRAWISGSTP